MKVLLSAFSCEPGRGSEPEVGFRALFAAARRHEVWALVSATGLPALEQALDGHPIRKRIRLVAIPVGADESTLSLPSFHRRYWGWQRRAGKLGRDLDQQIDFDVVHHVTLSPLWTPVGVASIAKPLVWGPVGGTVDTPLRLFSQLGPTGMLEDVARAGIRRGLARAPWTRSAPRRAAVILAQNAQTARRLRSRSTPRVLSNGTAVAIGGMPSRRERTSEIAFVGRLIGWKGPLLALRALRHVRHTGAHLSFYGAGRDEPRLRRAARRWGLHERVSFTGWLPREDVLARVACAGVLLYPSLHDEAGLAVAEALTLGTPVVCLDHGGPAEVVSHWPSELWTAVPPRGPAGTARALAGAVDAFFDDPPPVPATPLPPQMSFADAVESAYHEAGASRHHGDMEHPPPGRADA